MLTFLATFAVFVLVIFGMSLGWIIKRKSIQAAAVGSRPLAWKVCDCRNRAMPVKRWRGSSSAEFCKSRRNDNSRPHYCRPAGLFSPRFCGGGRVDHHRIRLQRLCLFIIFGGVRPAR